MSKITKLFTDLFDKARESEAFNQLKAKYDELDSQSKLYLNFGALIACVLFIALPVLIGVAKLNGMKSDINDREEMIGFLQRSVDNIRQLKSQQTSSHGTTDLSAPLPAFVDSVLLSSGLDRGKVEVGAERPGVDDKESHETLLDIKLTQVNLKQLLRLLFTITDMGSARSLNVKDLNVDTKGDPSGYIDANVTIASYKAK